MISFTVNPYDIQLDIPEPLVEGTVVEFNCTVPRTKPPAVDIYWLLDHVKYNGTIAESQNEDQTYNQTLFTFFKLVFCVLADDKIVG